MIKKVAEKSSGFFEGQCAMIRITISLLKKVVVQRNMGLLTKQLFFRNTLFSALASTKATFRMVGNNLGIQYT
jgi:hypothetical protein